MPSPTVVSIVTPTFNEEENITEFLRRVRQAGDKLEPQGIVLELVLVDDHSLDQTEAIVTRLANENPRLKYVRLSRNCGSHTAISAGLHYCTGACAVVMAADLQDPPELISQLLDRWRSGVDVVWAGRSRREGESLTTRLLSATYYRVMQWLALPQMPNQGADVVLLDRHVIDACNDISEKHTSLTAMILWMGFRQASIQYVKQARHAGKSKWTLAKKFKLAIDSIVSFSYAPIRLMSAIGVLMAAAGFLYATVTLVGWLMGTVTAGTGFAALMTVLLIGQGTIILMLGILGEYLWRTYDESRGRPRYIVERFAAFPDVPPCDPPTEESTDRLKSLDEIEKILTEV